MASKRTTGKIIDLMEALKESLTPSKSLTDGKSITMNESEIFCEMENCGHPLDVHDFDGCHAIISPIYLDEIKCQCNVWRDPEIPI